MEPPTTLPWAPTASSPLDTALVEPEQAIPVGSANDRPARLVRAIPVGFEPTTACLEGRCSIQLSYGILAAKIAAERDAQSTELKGRRTKTSQRRTPPEGGVLILSGRCDSNTRPPAPKAGTLTGLRYAPDIGRKEREDQLCHEGSRVELIHRLRMSAIPKDVGARFARRLLLFAHTLELRSAQGIQGDCARRAIPGGGGFKQAGARFARRLFFIGAIARTAFGSEDPGGLREARFP